MTAFHGCSSAQKELPVSTSQSGTEEVTGVGAVTAAMRRVSIGEKSPPFKRMICEVFTFKSMFAVIVVEDFFSPPLPKAKSADCGVFFTESPLLASVVALEDSLQGVGGS